MEIKTAGDLKKQILELQGREQRQKEQLVENFHIFKESLTPVNLLKSTFSKIKETPGITSTILKASLGLGAGFLSKKVLLGRSPGFLRKIIGSALQMGVTGLVAKKTDAIQASGGHFLKALFGSKRTV